MKKNHDIVTKAVAFNILDPDQKAMLDHALKRKNFSAYVKRLIQRDIEGTFQPAQHQKQIETAQKEEVITLDDDLMSGLI